MLNELRLHRFYAIKNIINGKVYVGQTMSTLQQRFYKHCYAAKNNSTTAIANALRKYGESAFEIILLQEIECFQSEADAIETRFICEYNSTNVDLGYNRTTGGNNCSTQLSQEAKDKISIANKGRIIYSRREKTKTLVEAKPLVALFQAGMSIVAISKQTNTTRQFVCSRLHKWKKYVDPTLPVGKCYTYKNSSASHKEKTLIRHTPIIDMLNAGKTRDEVCQHFNLKRTQLKSILAYHRLLIRQLKEV